MFQAPVPTNLLGPNGDLAQSADLWGTLNKMSERGGVLKCVDGMSVIVSIKDARYIVRLW